MLERLRVRYRDYRLRRVYAAVPELEEASREPLAEHLRDVIRPALISSNVVITLLIAAVMELLITVFTLPPDFHVPLAAAVLFGVLSYVLSKRSAVSAKRGARPDDLLVPNVESSLFAPVDSRRIAHALAMRPLLGDIGSPGWNLFGMVTLFFLFLFGHTSSFPDPIQMVISVIALTVTFEAAIAIAPGSMSALAAASDLEARGHDMRKRLAPEVRPEKLQGAVQWFPLLWMFSAVPFNLLLDSNTHQIISRMQLFLLLVACCMGTLLITERLARKMARNAYRESYDYFVQVFDFYRTAPEELRLKPGLLPAVTEEAGSFKKSVPWGDLMESGTSIGKDLRYAIIQIGRDCPTFAAIYRKIFRRKRA